MATQSEIPSSCPIRSSKPASVSSLTRASLKFDPKKLKLAITALFLSLCLIEGFRLAESFLRSILVTQFAT